MSKNKQPQKVEAKKEPKKEIPESQESKLAKKIIKLENSYPENVNIITQIVFL